LKFSSKGLLLAILVPLVAIFIPLPEVLGALQPRAGRSSRRDREIDVYKSVWRTVAGCQ